MARAGWTRPVRRPCAPSLADPPRVAVGWRSRSGIVLVAAAGTYVTFAPAPTPQVEPAASTSADATQPSSAEAVEAALNLSTTDRRRIQIALGARGFDTRGTDGTFGPRSREMIAAWQQAQKHPATGYLTAAESQALRDASPPPPRPAVDGWSSPPVVSGSFWVRCWDRRREAAPLPLAPMEADLRLAGRGFVGRLVHPVCGSLPVTLAVDPAGTVERQPSPPRSGGLHDQCRFGERPRGGWYADT